MAICLMNKFSPTDIQKSVGVNLCLLQSNFMIASKRPYENQSFDALFCLVGNPLGFLLFVLGKEPILTKGQGELMAAVEDVQIDGGFGMPRHHFVIETDALPDGYNRIEFAVKDFQICFGDLIHICNGRSDKHFFFAFAATVIDMFGIGRWTFCSPRPQIADWHESGDRFEICRAEACHQHGHMSAAAQSYEKYIACIDVFFFLDIIDGILNVLLGVGGAASQFCIRVAFEVRPSEFRQQQMKVLLLGKFEQILNLVCSIVTPCVQTDEQRAFLLCFGTEKKGGLHRIICCGADKDLGLLHRYHLVFKDRLQRYPASCP